jgi:hypothetical protein
MILHGGYWTSLPQKPVRSAPFRSSIWRASSGEAGSKRQSIEKGPDLLRIRPREPARPDPERVLEPDAHVAAHRRRLRRHAHLRAAGAQHRPAVVLAEEAVGGAPHVQDVLGMRADAAEDAEDRLDEQSGGLTIPRSRKWAGCRGG